MGNMTTITAQMSNTFAKRMVMASIESKKGSMKVLKRKGFDNST